MADKGMLTLSTKSGVAQDDRGLFWAGMDNMEALEQKVDLEEMLATKKKTTPTNFKITCCHAYLTSNV